MQWLFNTNVWLIKQVCHEFEGGGNFTEVVNILLYDSHPGWIFHLEHYMSWPNIIYEKIEIIYWSPKLVK